MKITYGSLFSGIGGFDLGFDRAGMQCVWQVEKDKHALQILERHWPKVKRFTDVTKFKRTRRTAVPDLICGGFPCQDLSVAGKRAGLAGSRSGLFWEFMRILSDFTPQWVLIENVPGLLSSWSDTSDGTPGVDFEDFRGAYSAMPQSNDLDTVLNELDKRGYGVAWRIFDSQYFGLAQRRERVFIVGCLGDVRRAAQVLFESDSLPWNPPPSRKGKPDVAHALANGTGSSGYRNDPNSEDFVAMPLKAKANSSHDESHETDVAFAQNSRDEVREIGGNIAGALAAEPGMKQQTYVAYRTNAAGQVDPQGDLSAALTQSTDPCSQIVAYQCQGSNVGEMGTLRKGNGNVTGGVPFIAHTLRAEGHDASEDGTGRGVPLVAATLRSRQHSPGVSMPGRGGEDDQNLVVAGSLTNRIDRGGVNSEGGDNHIIPVLSGVRRLTPVECERLQGFPDGFTEPLSDSARYRCLGNAVSVPVSEWIARRIVEVITRKDVAGGSVRN